ncbi:Callose synthase 9-like protein [Drosera capensis]
MSVIKQKLAKREDGSIDRSQDISRLQEFYKRYREKHDVDKLREDEMKLRESGVFSGNLGELERKTKKRKKVFATLKVLGDVLEQMMNEVSPEDADRLMSEELKRVMKSDAAMTGDLIAYNIIPMDAPTIANAIVSFAEVRAAMSALRYFRDLPKLPGDFQVPAIRGPDMFDFLHYVFGFQIRSLDGLQQLFGQFPMAFMEKLHIQLPSRVPDHPFNQVAETRKDDVARFSPFWNEIVSSLREEDYITNLDIAAESRDSQDELWERISRDEYMNYAVVECYYSIKLILTAVLEEDGRKWVERVYEDIQTIITKKSIHVDFQLNKLSLVIQKVTALMGVLKGAETPELEKGAVKAIQDLYDVMRHDVLTVNMREHLQTWNLLSKAHADGSLFSRLNWPKDPDLKAQIKRLYSLLTIKDSAANIPKNLEARRRLEFFTNSLFMDMPKPKPKGTETPELEKGAVKAIQDLYDVMRHDVLTVNMREHWETWNLLSKAHADGSLFSRLNWPKDPDLKAQIKRLYSLLTIKDSAANIPKNLEARRRLEFFTNSLFMDMPKPKPVREMLSFSVFTPYYSEIVLYSMDELRKKNEDGISILFYLQKIYPGMFLIFLYEWKNFLARIGRDENAQETELFDSPQEVEELRFWASYRGQTLARTVRGMMYYRKALMLQTYVERIADGDTEAPNGNETMSTQGFELSPEARAQADLKFTYVVTCQIYGKRKEEQKPQAADIALLMQQNEALRVAYIDVVETMKEGRVQTEYFSKLVKGDISGKDKEIYSIKLPGNPKLGEGKPENQNHAIVFTRGNAVQTIDMNQDNYFEEALKMRNLLEEFNQNHGIRPPSILGVREHGSNALWHPDVFDRIFHITRGGISKASRVINISEDIFAGFNSTLRQGNITHHEYIQTEMVGSTRSRYLKGKLLVLTVLTVYLFLYGKTYLALSGVGETLEDRADILGNTALAVALNAQFLFQIGIFTAVPMILGFILEQGIFSAIVSFITIQFQLCSVFFTFSLGTRTHYFGRTILHGGARYQATGRGFVVRHIRFSENYRLYSRSHFVKGFEVVLLLVVFLAYGSSGGGAISYILITISSWYMALSWLFVPYLFNPSGFEWQKTVEDFRDWTNWLLYRGGIGVKGEESWEAWWDEELVYGFSWAVLAALVVLFKVFSFSQKASVNFQLLLRFIQGVTFMLALAGLVVAIVLTSLSVPDIFACILAFLPTGWAILSIAAAWRPYVKKLGIWKSFRAIARLYDAGMGMLIFIPIALFSWFPFVSTFQTHTEAPNGNETMSTQGFELSPEARAQADLKFTYVVTCQIYGKQKEEQKPQAADIALLMQRNEALRVAYIDVVETMKEGRVQTEYFSKLVKGDISGKDNEIYSIKLPGNPKLGEGKPENQNHAIVFTRGNAVQTIDMNQDNYFEEALKMRNLLEEFHQNHGIRPPSILGVREHVVSSLASFMSNQETSFVTLGQRVLANPLKVRMHYGHPDVFDRIFHITRGGISKASRVINISEDIFAGFNSTLRQGNITHHEYIQVGKGRDVGLNQIAIFEGKVAGGNGEQVLSRDVYRLGQLFDFFRMMSFYFTTVGYYFCTMALSGVGETLEDRADILGNTALAAALNAQFLFQIGIFTAVPMILGFILEQGLFSAIVSFITMQFQLCSVFFTFSLGTRTHYFGRTILHGGARYQATGRGFVVRHIRFSENYRLYSRSHFVKGFEVVLLLVVFLAYGSSGGGAISYILITISSWYMALSWLFAPYLFNPSGFEWQKTVEDFRDWTNWLLYRGGIGVKGEESWEAWWDEELVYGLSWAVLAALVVLFKVFSFSQKASVNFQLLLRFIQGVTFMLALAGLVVAVVLTSLSVPDIFACILAFLPTGWAVLSIAAAWRPYVKKLGIWKSFRAIARLYDAGMGMLIFIPIALFSWFPFVSTFQTRLMFNQAFSRGLEISLILAGNNPNTGV